MEPDRHEIINGVKCYAPELAKENTGFPSDKFDFLYQVEEKNFWFRSRNRIIKYLFKKYLGTSQKSSVLEIGCGTGYVLSGLSVFPNYELTGTEIYVEGIKFAQKRLPQVIFYQADARKLPFTNKFDAIGAFDVLEHIDEDELVMKSIKNALKYTGLFFISVPQHPFLWSEIDDQAYHKRRYSRKELKQKLQKNGFEIIYISSFVFSLFPLLFISRKKPKRKKRGEKNQSQELRLPPLLNKLLEFIMYTDEFLIKIGFSLPFGGSLVAVCKINPDF